MNRPELRGSELEPHQVAGLRVVYDFNRVQHIRDSPRKPKIQMKTIMDYINGKQFEKHLYPLEQTVEHLKRDLAAFMTQLHKIKELFQK